MSSTRQTHLLIRFGAYEVDVPGRTLRKRGVRIKLQEQPFRLLALLVARPGEVVSREELRRALWPKEQYGEFDLGLNTAVKKLRRALSDSADDPRWIETVPRIGYRFVGPLNHDDQLSTVKAGARPHKEALSSRASLKGLLLLAAVIAASAFFGLWVPDRPGPQATPSVIRFSVETDLPSLPAVSPNGRHIAYFNSAGVPAIWVRDLNSEVPRRLDASAGAAIGPTDAPFWSPDSRFIAFVADGQLKRIGVDGGPATVLCELPTRLFGGGSWSPDGERVVFSASSGTPRSSRLYEVSAKGGAARPLFEPTGAFEDAGFAWPHFIPDGEHDDTLLYGLIRDRVPDSTIRVRNLQTGEDKPLGQGMFPVFSPTGHVLYLTVTSPDPNSRELWALPFSTETLSATGEPFPLYAAQLAPSVSRDGTLVYYDGSPLRTQLIWRNRQGEEVGTLGERSSPMRQPRISPNGRQVAMQVWAEANFDIWIQDVSRPARLRLTADEQGDDDPLWTPSGDRITFLSRRSGNGDVYMKPVMGGRDGGEGRALIQSDYFETPSDWSPDGKVLLFERTESETGSDIWYVQIEEDGTTTEPVAFLRTRFQERAARFSPDGLRIAYVSDETGRPEVYVQLFPEGGGKQRISRDGGAQPVWRGDGKELFYVEDSTLMAVTMVTSPQFSVGSTRALFESVALRDSIRPAYDVEAPDGQRFLLAEPVEDDGPSTIRVVQNWYEAFRERGPE